MGLRIICCTLGRNPAEPGLRLHRPPVPLDGRSIGLSRQLEERPRMDNSSTDIQHWDRIADAYAQTTGTSGDHIY